MERSITANSSKAVVSVLLAGILWGVINIFVKTLSAHGLDALQISAIRMVVAAVIFPLVVLIKDPSKMKIRLKDFWIFVGTGIISIVLFNTCYFYTMINSQASVAVVLLYTSPVFVMLLSALIFKEKITLQKIIALILTVAGCVLVAGVIGGTYTITPFVILTGIASGLFYALYSIFGNFGLRRYDPSTVTAWTFLFAVVVAVPLGKVGKTVAVLRQEPVLILYAVGIGVVSTILPYFFYTWGLNRMDPSKAAIIVAVEPLVGAVIGMTVFHEPHNILKLIGISLIIAAIVLLNLKWEKRSAERL